MSRGLGSLARPLLFIQDLPPSSSYTLTRNNYSGFTEIMKARQLNYLFLTTLFLCIGSSTLYAQSGRFQDLRGKRIARGPDGEKAVLRRGGLLLAQAEANPQEKAPERLPPKRLRLKRLRPKKHPRFPRPRRLPPPARQKKKLRPRINPPPRSPRLSRLKKPRLP